MSEDLATRDVGMIFDFRDGKISRSRTYLDKDEARRAAGLA
jgi:ketosteroid isomerase-like protein